jgi:pyruvyltransferase
MCSILLVAQMPLSMFGTLTRWLHLDTTQLILPSQPDESWGFYPPNDLARPRVKNDQVWVGLPDVEYHPRMFVLPHEMSKVPREEGPNYVRIRKFRHNKKKKKESKIPSRNLPFCPDDSPVQADWLMNTTTGSFWLPRPPSPESRISGYHYLDNKRGGLVHDDHIKIKMFYSYNAGDFLALYLGPMLSGRSAHLEDLWTRSSDSLALVGSILHQGPRYSWGAGFIDPTRKLRSNTQEVFAIRGPVSYQQYQNETNASARPSKARVSKVYGDAGTLMSWYYQPHNQTKRYSLCIMQHFREVGVAPVVAHLLAHWEFGKIRTLDIYGNLFTIMDQMVQCEYVLSSTLHGLIFADSYGIPNGHLDLATGKIMGGYHKYDDYFGSVGRKRTSLILPYNLTSGDDEDVGDVGYVGMGLADNLVATVLEFVTNSGQEYQPTIDIVPFWKQCPIHAEAYNRSRHEHYQYAKKFSAKFYKGLKPRPQGFRTFAKSIGAVISI